MKPAKLPSFRAFATRASATSAFPALPGTISALAPKARTSSSAAKRGASRLAFRTRS
jgi:hypothetical protein